MTHSRPRSYNFGAFRLDRVEQQLVRDNQPVPLTPKVFETLLALVERHGHLVTKEELFRTVWPDAFVEENNLAQNISILRQALGDSASAPRFIETVPRRGYRFLADVHPVETPEILPASAPDPAPMRESRRWRWMAGGAVVATAIIIGAWVATRADVGSTPPRSIAVLPFRPVVGPVSDEALEVGLAEAVIVRLGQLRELRVPSINAVHPYAGTDADPLAAGRQLGVDAVLDGRLLRRNGNVRLSARLLDVESGTTLWAQQWDFAWTDIFSVQDAMAAEVTRALALRLAPDERVSLRTHPTNIAAYDDYLRGRYLLLRRTLDNSRRAAELLERAVSLDPSSAAAHASLAFAYISIPLLEGPTTPFVELGRHAVRRALELDPRMAEAHAVLSRILVHFDWDTQGSDRAGQHALELDPTNPFVLHCRGLMLADQGRFEEALALVDRALALDPTSVLAHRDKAIMLYLARRYGECVEQCQRTLELDPYSVSAYVLLGRAYEEMGRSQQALQAYLAAFGFPEENGPIVERLRSAGNRGGLQEFWGVWLAHLLEEPQPRASAIAAAYVKVGDHDRAFEWLETLFAQRGARVVSLKVQPLWDPLRADPRFEHLLRRARLLPLTASASNR